MIEYKWELIKVNKKSIEKIAKTFNLPEYIARIMSIRGISSKNTSNNFFYPNRKYLHNPFLMHDMENAVNLILKAIKNNDTILVYGDYDVDGISSVSFLILFFQFINIESYYYIPNRKDEGHGLSRKGIDYAELIGANIIITCDCGITANDEVNYANEKNINVIITDHHKANNNLPKASAIINPNQKKCKYPFKGLSGSGVVFKLALAICIKGGFNSDYAWLNSDLVTLGIVADLVPINDENRIIVNHGISQIKKKTNKGLMSLLKFSKIIANNITSNRLFFGIIPKINAAGRLGDAGRAVKLMITKNPVLANEIASYLKKENNYRRLITDQIINEAINLIKRSCDLLVEKVIILNNNNWHSGVIGIVASRIKAIYFRPTIIIAMDNNKGIGSCRSIDSFNIMDTLLECKDCLEGFDGHPMAAGFSINSKKIEEFKKKFLKISNKKIKKEDLIPTIKIESFLNLCDLNHRMIKFLYALEPYGPENLRPIFVTKNLYIEGIPKLIGKSQKDLMVYVRQNKILFEAIGYNMSYLYEKLIQNNPVDIAYVIGETLKKGKKIIQLEIKDIKLSKNYV